MTPTLLSAAFSRRVPPPQRPPVPAVAALTGQPVTLIRRRSRVRRPRVEVAR